MNFLNNPNMINIIHIVFVTSLFVIIALDKFPENNYVSQRNFLLGVAFFVFVYHSYKIYTRSRLEGLDSCQPPMMVNKSADYALSDVALAGANIHHIRIFDSDPGFSTPSLKVKIGDVVVWTNVGELEHSITSADRNEWKYEKMLPSNEFHSGMLKPGQTYTVKFTKEGWFPYYCIHHKGWMSGEIIVG